MIQWQFRQKKRKLKTKKKQRYSASARAQLRFRFNREIFDVIFCGCHDISPEFVSYDHPTELRQKHAHENAPEFSAVFLYKILFAVKS